MVVSSNPVHGEVYSIQHYVIKFVGDLLQVCGFLRVLWFPLPIKLTATTYNLKYCWKWHYKPQTSKPTHPKTVLLDLIIILTLVWMKENDIAKSMWIHCKTSKQKTKQKAIEWNYWFTIIMWRRTITSGQNLKLCCNYSNYQMKNDKLLIWLK